MNYIISYAKVTDDLYITETTYKRIFHGKCITLRTIRKTTQTQQKKNEVQPGLEPQTFRSLIDDLNIWGSRPSWNLNLFAACK